ncbi:hypothetical protein EYF80_020793 [Liparis tanakae]|uniref:Uncharacterized protein n=1 Tax=Liparis tanakae TaxID=230148 RepID=A0A4Z2HVJ6_9TELE|nr:hypothetical protein EYF80_020793 [Liparis tanakae]
MNVRHAVLLQRIDEREGRRANRLNVRGTCRATLEQLIRPVARRWVVLYVCLRAPGGHALQLLRQI